MNGTGRVCLIVLLACVTTHGALADDLTFHNGRIVLETPDKNARLSLGGLVQVDGFAKLDGPSRFADVVRFRRLRPTIEGTLFQDWHFKAEYELTQLSESLHYFGKGWRSLWLAYSGIPHVQIRVGNQHSPVSLENVTSSSATTLLERSSADAFVQHDYLGGSIRGHWHGVTAAVGLFRPSLASRTGDANRGTSIAGRLTWAPVATNDDVVHLGLSGIHESVDSRSSIRISVHPLVDITPHLLVRTGSIRGVGDANLIGAEAAWAHGPWRIQGEYLRQSIEPRSGPETNFDGWYLQGSWLLTGETYRYSKRKGRFHTIEPNSDLGAVELALRYGTVDLNDQAIKGGVQRDVTLGVNWYIDRNIRLGANYIYAWARPNYRGVDESLSAILVRAQLKL